jgi:hypothetical protein
LYRRWCQRMRSRPDDFVGHASAAPRLVDNRWSLALELLYLPDDETCFLVFEAASADAVGEVCRRAGIGSARIVPAVE